MSLNRGLFFKTIFLPSNWVRQAPVMSALREAYLVIAEWARDGYPMQAALTMSLF